MTPYESPPARLSLPLSPEGYAQANEAFRQCWTADREGVLFLLQADMGQAPEEPRRDALAALDELARDEGGRRLLAHPSGVFAVRADEA